MNRRRKALVFNQQLSGNLKPDKQHIRRKNRKQMFYFLLVFIVLDFGFHCWIFVSRNDCITEINRFPVEAHATVYHVSTGKGMHTASYSFTIQGKKYSGSTHNTYNGQVNDALDIVYCKNNPNVNLCVSDMVPLTFWDDVVLSTLYFAAIIVGIILFFQLIYCFI